MKVTRTVVYRITRGKTKPLRHIAEGDVAACGTHGYTHDKPKSGMRSEVECGNCLRLGRYQGDK